MGGVCRASMRSFFIDCHSLRELRITSVLIIAAIQKETWVGFKCNGPVNFFSERRYFKYNTCVFPPCQPPPPVLPPRQASSPLLGNPPPPLSSQAPLLSRGRDISGSGAPTGVFSPEKGDPSDMTGSAGIFDGSEPRENSFGAQETGDDQQRLLPLPTPVLLMSLVRDWRQIGGREGGGTWLGSARGPHTPN
jgi:hypothetical protein